MTKHRFVACNFPSILGPVHEKLHSHEFKFDGNICAHSTIDMMGKYSLLLLLLLLFFRLSLSWTLKAFPRSGSHTRGHSKCLRWMKLEQKSSSFYSFAYFISQIAIEAKSANNPLERRPISHFRFISTRNGIFDYFWIPFREYCVCVCAASPDCSCLDDFR